MADRVVGNLAIRLDFDGAKFEQGITKAKRELSTYNKATQASTRIAKSDNYEKGKSAVALNNMQVQYKGLQGTLQSHADMNKKLIEQGKENSGAFEKNENAMRNYEVQMWELNEQYKQFQKEMYTANSGFTKTGDAMTKVGGAMQTFGSGLTEIGTGITKVGAMASASLGLVAKMAIEFEDGMVQVQKTTNASAEEMAVFEEQIRGLALAMPLAVGELANVAALAGQLGIAQEDIAGFTETMAMLGTATNLSAEEAGNALARFQNVTGTSVDTVENLGSAIVHLGNNVAATESEIINLAQMLAGSMVTVGASEIDILGLSAAMSALGITAERGGSSMSKFFVDLASYVSSGADELEVFAEVAGMSKEAFSELFTQDAMSAVEAFIVGLGGVGEKGGDMLAVLDELGIGEVRLRDTILRLANGHDVLSESLDLSKEGFEENIALTEEYELLAGTTASQIQIAKNQLQDLAITAGQELLPAIIDLLNNSDGIIDMLKGAVDWFVSLDDEMKQNLVKWSAMALVIGPVVSGLGNVISGLGGLVTMGGGALTVIGKLEGALKAKAAGGLVEATVASQGLAGAKGLGGVVTAITGGTGLIWALGLAGVAFAGWTWWDKWGRDAREAGQRTQRWGYEVTEETEKVLENFQGLADGVHEATNSMSEDAETGGQQAMQGYAKMVEGIKSTVGENLEEINGFYQGLDSTSRGILEESTNKQIEELERVTASSEKYYELINGVYAKAVEENRKLTESELDRVERYHNQLARLQAEALGGTEEQIRQTQALLTEQLEGMTNEQLQIRRNALTEDAKVTSEHHAEQLAMLEERFSLGLIEEEEYNATVVSMRSAHKREMNDIMDEQIKAAIAQGIEEKGIVHQLASTYEEYGYTREEVEKRVQEMLKSTQNEAYALDQMWRDLLIDPVTGEVVTNLPDVLADMMSTDEGWRELDFMIKEANLTTNTLAILEEALWASGEWDKLDPEVKDLLADAQGFMTELSKSEEQLDRWNRLPEEEKLILGNNLDLALELMRSEEMLKRWDSLPEEEKKMLGNNEQLLREILSSEEKLKEWNRLKPEEKKLLANNSAIFTSVDNAQRKINSLRGKSVKLQTVHESVYTSVNRAGSSASSQRAAQSGYTFSWARGTNHHPGGLAMVNDQMGSLYKELITLPDGRSFIPKGRNVVLDLPEGSKVLRAALTKMKIPKYRDGIGYSKPQTQQIISGSNTDMSQTNSLLSTLIQLVGQGQVINLDGDQVGKAMYPRIDSTMSSNMQRNQIMNMGG